MKITGLFSVCGILLALLLMVGYRDANLPDIELKGVKGIPQQDEPIDLDNRIWVVFQDSKGVYWFGSNGKGLYRYEDETLKLFTIENGLIDNTIRGIQEDHLGYLFIETPEGISKYDGSSFTTLIPEKSTFDQWKLLPNDLWFGYNTNDVQRYDGTSLFVLPLPRKDLKEAFGVETYGLSFKSNNNTPYAVFGVDKDKEGNLWLGTVTAGAFRYDGESFIWFAEKELSTLPDGRVPGVRSMIQDRNGYFWLSNFKSKYKIDPHSPNGYQKLNIDHKSSNFFKKELGYFNSGLVGRKGDLWMTTYGGGVWNYDGENLAKLEIKKDGKDVLLISIFEDKDGLLWLGTDNDGVYKQSGEVFVKFMP